MTAEYSSLTVEHADAVAVVTLNRPEIMNRFDVTVLTELAAAYHGLAHDPEVRAIVLASTGKAFSAGGDMDMIRRMNTDADRRAEMFARVRALVAAYLAVPQPIVCAVHGAAMGAGANFALACDLVVASRNVLIGDPHVAVGLVAGEGGAIWWPHSVGLHRARRHLLTGKPIDAATAHTYGLVTDLVETPEEVRPAAVALAGEIAALPPLAVRGTKRVLNKAVELHVGEVLDLGLSLEERTMASADLMEAITAFKEKRPGRYAGR